MYPRSLRLRNSSVPNTFKAHRRGSGTQHMPRYHFDIEDKGRIITDHAGLDFDNVTHARVEPPTASRYTLQGGFDIFVQPCELDACHQCADGVSNQQCPLGLQIATRPYHESTAAAIASTLHQLCVSTWQGDLRAFSHLCRQGALVFWVYPKKFHQRQIFFRRSLVCRSEQVSSGNSPTVFLDQRLVAVNRFCHATSRIPVRRVRAISLKSQALLVSFRLSKPHGSNGRSRKGDAGVCSDIA